MSRAAAFIDRDGVINRLIVDPASATPESPLTVADVALIDGASRALARLAAAGFALVGASNQPAAAKRRVSVRQLDLIQARVLELLAGDGVWFDDFRLCFHHPDGTDPDLSGACECRKPAPGMLLQAAVAHDLDLGRSWMVGDTDADVLAGRAAGCRTALVLNPDSAHKRIAGVAADLEVPSLASFASEVLRSRE